MSNHSKYLKGNKVYRSRDPDRKGYLTGRKYDKNKDVFYQIDFNDGNPEYVPEYEIEQVDTAETDIPSLVEQRKFGRASDLRRNLSHVQINGKLSSIIYSMDITNTEFLPYQFKPVLAFLESPADGLLIADEVGLGKTIEAGLIWTELRAREDYRRILVVCPAMLREKWRDELRKRFGIDATIMNASELLDELKNPLNSVADGRGIICSMQGIRPPNNSHTHQSSARNKLSQFLAEQSDNLPKIIDLVVIDEAHYMRNRSSQNAKLGKLLRDVSKNVVLLSATPINLRSDDLFSLLNIVDQDTFDVPHFFPQVLKANKPLIQARELAHNENASAKEIQQCLKEAARLGHGFLDNSVLLQDLIKTLDKSESVATEPDRVRLANKIDKLNLLRHVVNRSRKADVFEKQVIRKPYDHFVELDENGIEKKFYDAVTNTIRDYASGKNISAGFLLASPQHQMSSCMYAAAKSWSDKSQQALVDLAKNMQDEDADTEIHATKYLSPLIGYLAKKVIPSVDIQSLRDTDSKFAEFYNAIKDYIGQDSKEKIVVFSYFRGTLEYLNERLTEENIPCQILMGGMKESKQDIIDQFRDTESIKVLLSSDVASEGVDLQFCRVIVNYELPWNPMKIEQRIGRLDRIGQQAESISIVNLGYANTIDQRIYQRLFERIKIFEHALGGMEAMLGEEIKKLTSELLVDQLTPQEQEDRIAQTAQAIENNRQMEDRLEKDAGNLIAHSDYILDKVKIAHDLKKQINENDLIIYVRDYLNKYSPGHEFHQPENGKHRFYITLPAKTAAQLDEFVSKKRMSKQTRLISGERVQCEFINKTNNMTRNVEQINQFHPLIRFISAQFKTEDFYPVTAVRLPLQINNTGLSLLRGQYAFTIYRWKFTGLRDEEDIRIRVIHLEQDFALDSEDSWKLLNAVRLYGLDWPESATETSSNLMDKIFDCQNYLDSEFKQECDDRKSENEDRVNFQIRSATQLRNRKIESHELVIENHRIKNNTTAIHLTESKINKAETNFNVRIEVLKGKANMKHKTKPICCGVLFID